MRVDFFAGNRHLGQGLFQHASIQGVYHYRCIVCDKEFLTEVCTRVGGETDQLLHQYWNSLCWDHRHPSQANWPIASGMPPHWFQGHLSDLQAVPPLLLQCGVQQMFEHQDWINANVK